MDLTLQSDLYNNVKFNMHKLILDIRGDDYERISEVFHDSPDQIKELAEGFSNTLDRQAEELQRIIPLPEIHGEKAVAFIGDSITSDRESFMNIIKRAYGGRQELHFIDAAVSGDKSDDAKMKFYIRTMNYNPDIVHILIGTNDMRESDDRYGDTCVSLGDYKCNLDYMVKCLVENGKKVILSTVSPVCMDGLKKRFPEDHWMYHKEKIENVNEILETLALKYEVKLNDMRPVYGKYEGKELLLRDGLHLNEKGQQLLAQHVLSALAEYL